MPMFNYVIRYACYRAMRIACVVCYVCVLFGAQDSHVVLFVMDVVHCVECGFMRCHVVFVLVFVCVGSVFVFVDYCGCCLFCIVFCVFLSVCD